jgi:hypothetical protein
MRAYNPPVAVPAVEVKHMSAADQVRGQIQQVLAEHAALPSSDQVVRGNGWEVRLSSRPFDCGRDVPYRQRAVMKARRLAAICSKGVKAEYELNVLQAELKLHQHPISYAAF